MNERVKAILSFWFVESSPKDLFKRSDEFDQKIRSQFMDDYKKAIWIISPFEDFLVQSPF